MSEPTPGAGAKGRILVIDDSELVLDITREALEEAGYEVVTNSSWMEVNATIRERRPDMILLDLMMPSIRGESLCEILKKSSFGRTIPIIIFSTKDEAEIRMLAEEAGADGWIVTNLDVLSGFAEISVATRYDIGGRQVRDWPAQLPSIDAARPVYQSHPGWSEDITRVRKFEDLPSAARGYVEFLEREVGAPVLMISVGPERDQVIQRGRIQPS